MKYRFSQLTLIRLFYCINIFMRSGKQIPIHKRVCYGCGSNKTRIHPDQNYPMWYLNHDDDNNMLCDICYRRFFENPPKAAKQSILNKTRITFKDIRIVMGVNLRTGYCSKCTNNIYNRTCKNTVLHHAIDYIIILPWFGTQELCRKCHMRAHKTTRIIRKLDHKLFN